MDPDDLMMQRLFMNNNNLHDFDYDSSYGQKVCLNCGVIDPRPLLITTTELSYYRPRSKPNQIVYLKKCVLLHEDQYNCSIPYDIFDDLKNSVTLYSECHVVLHRNSHQYIHHNAPMYTMLQCFKSVYYLFRISLCINNSFEVDYLDS